VKTSLDHLPEEKREQIERLVGIIREAGPVEMIILFGSHARGNWVEDPETGYESDYDLLVLVKSPKEAEDYGRWGSVEQRMAQARGMPPVTLIVHDFKFMNRQLEHGQYFFSDVANEGVLLYTSGAFKFTSHRVPSPAERRKQAETDFESWIKSADEFYDTYEDDLRKARHNKSAFELHQAAERFFAAFLLVFTAYKPQTHNLETLANHADNLHPAMRAVLPRTLEEDKRLFELLKKAYVDARYNRNYRITAEELGVLGPRVRELRAAIERACREKLATLG
jgi:uncharacterized protein